MSLKIAWPTELKLSLDRFLISFVIVVVKQNKTLLHLKSCGIKILKQDQNMFYDDLKA